MNRKSSFHFLVVSVVMNLLVCSYGRSQTSPEEIATRIDEYLSILVEEGEFSGSVLFADDGEVLLSKGYGMANIEHGVPNTPHTKFRIGSITKQFTAMAIMMLQERGWLNVQDSICIYVPDCPRAWEAITIHHLLTHTSGIPNFTDFPDIWDFWRLPRTVGEIITLFKDRPLRFTPGVRFEYSNSGYVLLGFIIEVVTGESYEDFLEHNIFEPLGMSNSGYDHSRTILMDRAAGYARENNTLLNAIHIEMDTPHAAGALYSTVEDLFMWDQALYSTDLVSQSTLDAIFAPHVSLSNVPGFGDVWDYYGYGWAIGERFNRKSLDHGGSISGFQAHINRFPEEKVCIIVLSNFEFTSMGSLGEALPTIVKDVFGPILHWALDETEGDVAHDSAFEHDGTLNGNPIWQPKGGMVAGALQFDGVDDYVSTEFVLNPADGAFSVFAWIKGGAPGEVVLSQAGGANWLCTDTSEGNLMTEVKGTGRGDATLLSQTVITNDNWHRIGLVWDGSHRTLYVDGIVAAEDTQTNLLGSENGLYIGTGTAMEPGTFWSGLIDDVRIYNQALDAEEIEALAD